VFLSTAIDSNVFVHQCFVQRRWLNTRWWAGVRRALHFPCSPGCIHVIYPLHRYAPIRSKLLESHHADAMRRL
jgi:hypothetical protein